MAITRFTQNTPVEHTGKFFDLPLEQLSVPILAADAARKEQETALDTILGEYASREYLPSFVEGQPGDQDIASRFLDDLYSSEEQLRKAAEGDVLSRQYQEGLKGILRKEANKDFYKKASYNFKTYNEKYLPHYMNFVKATGAAPEDWQDQYGSRMKGYANALGNGTVPFQGIEPEVAFTPLAVEYLTPYIENQLNLPDGRVEVKTGTRADGTTFEYLVDTKTGKTGKHMIKDILKDSELTQKPHASYSQLRRRYDANPDLATVYGTFEKFFEDTILESIANNLAREYSVSVYRGPVRPNETSEENKPKRTAAQNARDTAKALSTTTQVPKGGAINPIGVPSRNAAKALGNYMNASFETLMEGGTTTNERGEDVTVPNVVDRIYQIANVPKPEEGEDGIIFEAPFNPDVGYIEPTITYTNSFGERKKVSLLHSMDGYKKATKDNLTQVLGTDFLTFMTQLSDLNREISSYYKGNESTEALEENAIEYGFGEQAGMIKNIGFDKYYANTYGEKAYSQAINDPFLDILKGLKDGSIDKEEARKLLNNRTPTGAEDALLQGNKAVMLEAYTFPSIEQIQSLFSLPDEQVTIPGTEEKHLGVFLSKIDSGEIDMGIAVNDDGTLTDDFEQNWFIQKLQEKGDKKTQKYTSYWQDNWEKGLDIHYNYLAKDPNRSGIQVGEKTIYHFNVNNTTGSGSGKVWSENYNDLINDIVTTLNPGKGNQLATSFSGVPLYDFETNEAIDEPIYKALAGHLDTEKNEIIPGFAVTGWTFDDEGINIILQGTKGKKAANRLYELRDQNFMINYLSKAGKGDEYFLRLADNLMKSFEATPGKVNTAGFTEPDVSGTLQAEGQATKKYTGVVGMGPFQQTVRILPYESKNPKTGAVMKKGTMEYYSVQDKEFKYFDNAADLVADGYLKDLIYLQGLSGKLLHVHDETFNKKFIGLNDFKNKGVNVLSEETINGLQDLSNDPEFPGQMRITSLFRGDAHDLSVAYEEKTGKKSAHTIGDAVDLAILDKDGELEKDKLEFMYAKYKQFKDDKEYHVQMEFPPLINKGVETGFRKLYNELVSKYGSDFVRVVDHATWPHVHYQYLRESK